MCFQGIMGKNGYFKSYYDKKKIIAADNDTFRHAIMKADNFTCFKFYDNKPLALTFSNCK